VAKALTSAYLHGRTLAAGLLLVLLVAAFGYSAWRNLAAFEEEAGYGAVLNEVQFLMKDAASAARGITSSQSQKDSDRNRIHSMASRWCSTTAPPAWVSAAKA